MKSLICSLFREIKTFNYVSDCESSAIYGFLISSRNSFAFSANCFVSPLHCATFLFLNFWIVISAEKPKKAFPYHHRWGFYFSTIKPIKNNDSFEDRNGKTVSKTCCLLFARLDWSYKRKPSFKNFRSSLNNGMPGAFVLLLQTRRTFKLLLVKDRNNTMANFQLSFFVAMNKTRIKNFASGWAKLNYKKCPRLWTRKRRKFTSRLKFKDWILIRWDTHAREKSWYYFLGTQLVNLMPKVAGGGGRRRLGKFIPASDLKSST